MYIPGQVTSFHGVALSLNSFIHHIASLLLHSFPKSFPNNVGSPLLLNLCSYHSLTWNALHLCLYPMSSIFHPCPPQPLSFSIHSSNLNLNIKPSGRSSCPFSFIPIAPWLVYFIECFSNFNVHKNHLGILLNCKLFQKENLSLHF